MSLLQSNLVFCGDNVETFESKYYRLLFYAVFELIETPKEKLKDMYPFNNVLFKTDAYDMLDFIKCYQICKNYSRYFLKEIPENHRDYMIQIIEYQDNKRQLCSCVVAEIEKIDCLKLRTEIQQITNDIKSTEKQIETRINDVQKQMQSFSNKKRTRGEENDDDETNFKTDINQNAALLQEQHEILKTKKKSRISLVEKYNEIAKKIIGCPLFVNE